MQDASGSGRRSALHDELETLRAALEQLKRTSRCSSAPTWKTSASAWPATSTTRAGSPTSACSATCCRCSTAWRRGWPTHPPTTRSLREGLELTQRQLLQGRRDNGLVTVAPATGEAFDPERHQAMSMVDAPGIAPGAVAQTFQKGYVLNERLLRPALVVVARHD